MPKNVGDLGKLTVAKGFQNLLNKSPNLVTCSCESPSADDFLVFIFGNGKVLFRKLKFMNKIVLNIKKTYWPL